MTHNTTVTKMLNLPKKSNTVLPEQRARAREQQQQNQLNNNQLLQRQGQLHKLQQQQQQQINQGEQQQPNRVHYNFILTPFYEQISIDFMSTKE